MALGDGVGDRLDREAEVLDLRVEGVQRVRAPLGGEVDELLDLANQQVEGILLSSYAAEDDGLAAHMGIDVIDEKWMALGEISGAHLDLLERQLQLIKRMITPPDGDTPQGFLPF